MNLLLTLLIPFLIIATVAFVIVMSLEIRRILKEEIAFYNSWIDGGYVPYEVTYEED